MRPSSRTPQARHRSAAYSALLWIPIAATLIAACQPQSTPVEVQLSKVEPVDTVALRVGESARLQPLGTVVSFVTVLEDSRCPAGVTCVWAGNVRAAMMAWENAGAATRFDLASNGEPWKATVGAVELRIVGVRPDLRDDRPIEILLEVRFMVR